MNKQLRILGTIFIVYHAFALLLGLFFIIGVPMIMTAYLQPSQLVGPLLIIPQVIGGILLLLALPGIIGGYGLLERKPWGRIVCLIVACLDFLNFPLGSALCVYAFIILMDDEVIDCFSRDGETERRRQEDIERGSLERRMLS